jgi:hypothetical protein
MPRNLNRKIGIYISRLGELKYAEIGSPKAAEILALRAGYQLCASVDSMAEVSRIFYTGLCRHLNGVYVFPGVTYPTQAELDAIGERIEKRAALPKIGPTPRGIGPAKSPERKRQGL